jgi:hypothetical protein
MSQWITSVPSYELGRGGAGTDTPSGVITTTAWVCSGGRHEWLPWLHRADGYVTRCVHCGREEQFADTEEGTGT